MEKGQQVFGLVHRQYMACDRRWIDEHDTMEDDFEENIQRDTGVKISAK